MKLSNSEFERFVVAAIDDADKKMHRWAAARAVEQQMYWTGYVSACEMILRAYQREERNDERNSQC